MDNIKIKQILIGVAVIAVVALGAKFLLSGPSDVQPQEVAPANLNSNTEGTTVNTSNPDPVPSNTNSNNNVQNTDPTQNPAVSPTPPNTGKTTSISFNKLVHDFGTIQTGDIVNYTFTFTNTGDEPLIISDAKGTCGCTVPKYPKEPVMPGETANMEVQFDSKGKTGQQNKQVNITANTNPATTTLTIKSTVEGEVKKEEPTVIELDSQPTGH